MPLDPKLVLTLAKLGVDVVKLGTGTIDRINAVLSQKYRFERPRKFPRLGFSTFSRVRHATIGGRQYVLERGRLRGRYWRIREKTHPFVTAYFVWDQYETECEALEHWEGFAALLRARSELGGNS